MFIVSNCHAVMSHDKGNIKQKSIRTFVITQKSYVLEQLL